jgi:hypothetical protein
MNLAASVRNWGKREDFRGSHKACAGIGVRERTEAVEVRRVFHIFTALITTTSLMDFEFEISSCCDCKL